MTVPKPVLDSRRRFLADVGAAVPARSGFAAGKIGYSEQHWLYYPVFLAGTSERRRIRAYELLLWRHFEQQSGIFGTALEPAIVRHHTLPGRFIHFRDLEPDRSAPADDSNC